MAGFVLSNLIGLVKWILVSRAFGTGAEIDAFNAANRLPETLFYILAGGALASAFVPTFTGLLSREDPSRAWRLASAIGNLVFLGMTLAAAISWLAAPWLVQTLFGFEDPAQIGLTISLLRVLLISPIVFGVSGLLMGILNAHQHFLLPALAPSALWLGWIAGVVLLAPRFGIHGLAWGVVLGSVLHLGVQLPALRGRGARYHLELGLADPAVRQVGRLMGPRLVGVAVVQLNFLINVVIASTQPEGSLTAINYSFFIMLMPQVVIAQSIAIAALPTFSVQAAEERWDELRTSLARALRGVVFLSLPASLGLILLRAPIVALLFERGAFDAASTELVAWALLWYAAGLVGHALVEILSRAFYALQDTRTPVAVGAAAMTLNVILSFTFSALFTRVGWAPHGGLALANSLATALEAAVLLILMRGRLRGLNFQGSRRGFAATLVASGVMSGALWLWLRTFPGEPTWFIGLGGVILGGAVYWMVALAAGAPEARELPALVLRR